MILVDSSVWIDYFRGPQTPQANALDRLLGSEVLVMGDLILAEVLQGFTSDKHFADAQRLMTCMEVVTIGGPEIAIAAATNYRALRSMGVSVRKTIDTLIATRCIVDHLELLHNDRDFDPFEQHLGLQCVDPQMV